MTNIAFIGAGNIAKAIMGGYLRANPSAKLCAADPIQEQLDTVPGGIQTTQDNMEAANAADIVVLCVKPNHMAETCKALAPLSPGKLFISVAAGVTSQNLQAWLGAETAIIRCMPNTPALVGEGMTGLFATANVTESDRQLAAEILSSVGTVSWFEAENDLNAVTAVSGSGPAYYFLMLETMQNAAEKLGLPSDRARLLVQQTALGAVKMAIESDLTASELRRNVTSPGGTTAAALKVFEDHQFANTVEEALQAASTRSVELSED